MKIESVNVTVFQYPTRRVSDMPFYLNIQRLNPRTRLLYTSRAPSLLCET